MRLCCEIVMLVVMWRFHHVMSQRQVYLEVQQAVMTSSLQCSVEVAIQLAAHALQATHSDQNLNTDQDWMEVSLPLRWVVSLRLCSSVVIIWLRVS